MGFDMKGLNEEAYKLLDLGTPAVEPKQLEEVATEEQQTEHVELSEAEEEDLLMGDSTVSEVEDVVEEEHTEEETEPVNRNVITYKADEEEHEIDLTNLSDSELSEIKEALSKRKNYTKDKQELRRQQQEVNRILSDKEAFREHAQRFGLIGPEVAEAEPEIELPEDFDEFSDAQKKFFYDTAKKSQRLEARLNNLESFTEQERTKSEISQMKSEYKDAVPEIEEEFGVKFGEKTEAVVMALYDMGMREMPKRGQTYSVTQAARDLAQLAPKAPHGIDAVKADKKLYSQIEDEIISKYVKGKDKAREDNKVPEVRNVAPSEVDEEPKSLEEARALSLRQIANL